MDVLKEVVGTIAVVMGKKPEEIKPEMKLDADLKVDELDGVEIIMALEEIFNIIVNDEDVEKLTTVQQVVDYITDKIKPESGH